MEDHIGCHERIRGPIQLVHFVLVGRNNHEAVLPNHMQLAVTEREAIHESGFQEQSKIALGPPRVLALIVAMRRIGGEFPKGHQGCRVSEVREPAKG